MELSPQLWSIYEVPGLGPLAPIADSHGVRFSLHGSAARRSLLAAVAGASEPPELFDLAPFTSDVNLVHNGTSEQTPAILRDIAFGVPFFEFFRWQLASQADRRAYDESHAAAAHLVPDDWVSVDADGIRDPLSAAADYRERRVRFELGPLSEADAIRWSGHALPVFAAMRVMRNAFQAMPYLDDLDLIGELLFDAIANAIQRSWTDPRWPRLMQEPEIVERFFDGLGDMVTAAPSRRVLTEVMTRSGLDVLVKRLADLVPGSARRADTVVRCGQGVGTAITSSELIGGGRRLPWSLQSWDISDPAGALLRSVPSLQSIGESGDRERSDVPLMVSEPIAIVPGEASSGREVDGERHEFLHLHIPLSSRTASRLAPFDEDDLASIVTLCELTSDGQGADIPDAALLFPTTCTYRYGNKNRGSALQLRINAFGTLAAIHDAYARHCVNGQPAMQIFVVRPYRTPEPYSSLQVLKYLKERSYVMRQDVVMP